MQQLAVNRCFGGAQYRYCHQSEVLDCEMKFSVFLPKQIALGVKGRLPVLYWLSGLTSTDENFVQKAGAQRLASDLGLVVVTPDTSPRGENVADDPEGAYDLGLGAGFYLNATAAPWDKHYHMYDYVVTELPQLLKEELPIDPERQAISGHSMGGHGALTIALKNPDRYRSVSAFAPIVSPLNCPWGKKAIKNYLADDLQEAEKYDSCQLIIQSSDQMPMLIDQGTADEFLETQLKPQLLVEACQSASYPLTFNLRDNYDHSYFFIASFIDEHLRFHARHLGIEVADED